MMIGVRCSLIFLFLLLPTARVFSQSTVALGFERDINRYRWTATIDSREEAGDWQFNVSDRFSSDAYALFTNSFLFRDENRLDWSARRRINSQLSFDVLGEADWFSLSRVFIQSTLTGLTYRPSPNLVLAPRVGVAVDQRPGISPEAGLAPLRGDVGPAFGLHTQYSESGSSGEYALRVQADGDVQQIKPRLGHQVRLFGEGTRIVSNSQFAANVIASTFRRDTYQAVSFLNRDVASFSLSESVEQTTTDTLGINIETSIPVRNNFRFAASGDLAANGRTVQNTGNPDETLFFDTKFNRRSFDYQGSLVRETTGSRLELSVMGGVEEESRSLTNRDDLPNVQAQQKSNLLRQADYDRGFFSLATATRITIARRYILSVSGSARILNHNTPESNPDDRDEVSFTSRAGLRVQISPELKADLNFYGTRYETVYLKAARSAENNVQRSIRLSPLVTWTPDKATSITLRSEVRATYTVDEFTLAGRRPRDQSARELRYEIEGRRSLADNLAIISSASYSTLHLGRFLEDSFSEIPFDTLRVNKVWFRIQAGTKHIADIGIRTLVRSDYNQNTSVAYHPSDADGNLILDPEGAPILSTIVRPGRNIIRQIGPTASVVWPMNHRSSLRLNGWLIFQRVFQRLYGELPEQNAINIERSARRGKTSSIPSMSMTLRWTI